MSESCPSLSSSLVYCSLSGQCCLFCLQLVVFLRQEGNTASTLTQVAGIQVSLCTVKERNYCEGTENEDIKWPVVRGCCIVLGLINCSQPLTLPLKNSFLSTLEDEKLIEQWYWKMTSVKNSNCDTFHFCVIAEAMQRPFPHLYFV